MNSYTILPLILSSLMMAMVVNAQSANVHLASKDGIEGQWTVVMKDDHKQQSASFSINDAMDIVSEVFNQDKSASTSGGSDVEIQKVYTRAIPGFHAKMSYEDAMTLATDPRIAFIEQSRRVSIPEDQASPQQVQEGEEGTVAAVVAENYVEEGEATSQWGIDRIDSRDIPLNNIYNPKYKNEGAGVKVYVVDTGIQISHNDFGGRAVFGMNAMNDGIDTDCHGHGTHVAGSVGGTTWGVAKSVELVDIKVLGCDGSSTDTSFIDGMEWLLKNATAPAIVNMSLGGGFSLAFNLAVENLVKAGLTVVVAAGNDNADACDYSPASEPSAITVGSTASNDSRSSFSNYGSCVDIFAPGSSIISAWIGDDDAIKQIDGTSMACPHVAGVAALILGEKDSPAEIASTSPAEIASELISMATVNRITDTLGSPNKLLFVGHEPSTALCSEATIEITLRTDNDPSEISYELINECTGEVEFAKDEMFYIRYTYYESKCVPHGSYTFTVKDSYGDGFCCSRGYGAYAVEYNGAYEVNRYAEFTSSESTSFGDACAPSAAPSTSPPPTTSPAPSRSVDAPNGALNSRVLLQHVVPTILLVFTLFV